MSRALLAINVLIAPPDQSHLLHRPATRWLERHLEHGCFASFDQRINLDLMPSATVDHLCLIPCAGPEMRL